MACGYTQIERSVSESEIYKRKIKKIEDYESTKKKELHNLTFLEIPSTTFLSLGFFLTDEKVESSTFLCCMPACTYI